MEFELPKVVAHENAQFKTSVIGEDMQIEGNIHSNARVIIKGNVTGDISAKNVSIGQNAVLIGNIYADSVEVSGKMTGEIITHDLNITSTASISGKIQKTTISIEFGAEVDADIKAN